MAEDMATINYRDENGNFQEIALEGAEGGVSIIDVYPQPGDDTAKLAANIAAYAAVRDGVKAVFRMVDNIDTSDVVPIICATAAFLQTTQMAVYLYMANDINSSSQTAEVSNQMYIGTNDGAIHKTAPSLTVPSVEKVEEMIAAGGGGGGSTADLYPTEYSSEFNDDFTN